MGRNNVFHIMHVLNNLGMGGAEIGVLRLIRSFSGTDIQHSITILGTDQSLLDSSGDDIKIHSLNISGRSYFAFLKLKNIIQKEKVDIVHVNNLAPWFDCLLAAKMAGCRCVETFHGVEQGGLSFSSLRKSIYRFSGKYSDAITVVAKPAGALLTGLTGIARNQFDVIPNGVDTNVFSPPPSLAEKMSLRRQKGLPENNLIFGCVAALRPVKNHHGLLQAFAEVFADDGNEATLVLVGDGSLQDELKRLAESLGLKNKVSFLGLRSDIDELLRCFDIFVLNSHTEGLSYAVLEAMASGLPVMATAVGENKRLITNGEQGFLVAPDDIKSLTAVLYKMAAHPELLASMGVKARSLVIEKYSMPVMVLAYQQLYERLRIQ